LRNYENAAKKKIVVREDDDLFEDDYSLIESQLEKQRRLKLKNNSIRPESFI